MYYFNIYKLFNIPPVDSNPRTWYRNKCLDIKNDFIRNIWQEKKCEVSPVAHVTIVLFQGFVPVLGGGKTNVSGTAGPTRPVLCEQCSVLAHVQS